VRALVIFLLFVALRGLAVDTSDITNRVVERHGTNDGRVDYRVEYVYRGKSKVLAVMSRRNMQGLLAVTSRSYLVGGDLVMTESDEDGDGVFETIAVYRPGTDDMEVFTRQPDGSIRPVSTQTLQAYKKQNAAISEFWDKAFDKKFDEKKLPDLIRETQKKIQEAEHQKPVDKK
jgi:hypothetical protein